MKHNRAARRQHLQRITCAAAPSTIIGAWDADLTITASPPAANPSPSATLDTPDATSDKAKGGPLANDKKAQCADGKPPVPRFNLAAYNGGPMRLGGWKFPVVVESSGVKMAAERIPLYVFHEDTESGPDAHMEQLAGQIHACNVVDGKLVAEGDITGESETVKNAMKHAKNGFKWQASINAMPNQGGVEFIKEGSSAIVNGKPVIGPCVVARSCTMDHIALVPLGADTTTSARIAAQAAHRQETHMEFAAWLKAEYGMNADTLDADQRAKFTAKFEAAAKAISAGAAGSTDKPAITASNTGSATVLSFETAIKAQNEALAANMERVAKVQEVCKDFPAIAAAAIKENWTMDHTELKVLEAKIAAAKVPGNHAGQFNINTNNAMPEFKAGLALEASSGGRHMAASPQADALSRMIEAKGLLSCGYSGERLAKDGCYGSDVVNAAADQRFGRMFGRQLGPIGIFRMAAHFAGVQLPDKSNQSEFFNVLRADFSTMNLPVILSNLMNKFLLDGYFSVDPDECDPNAENSVAWQKFVRRGPVQDFKPHFRVRLTGNLETKPLGPAGEIQHGQISEQTYTIQAKTRAIMLAITREAIINDDLSAMSTVPTHIGVGHGRTIAKVVYATLLSNLQSDWSTAFFSAAVTTAGSKRGINLNTSSALSYTTLAAARAFFALQTDPTGAPFGQQAKIMLIPPSLISTALGLYAPDALVATGLTSTSAKEVTPSKQALAGLYKPVCSSWLVNCPAVDLPGGVTFAGSAGADATSWYLFCSPTAPAYAMEAGFLNGQEMPIVERAEAEFDTLGIAMRGFGDFGVSMAEPRAGQKNNA